MAIVKIILCIICPPIAAFLQVGASAHLWINIVLCFLGGFPGMIHALWLVLTDQQAPGNAAVSSGAETSVTEPAAAGAPATPDSEDSAGE